MKEKLSRDERDVTVLLRLLMPQEDCEVGDNLSHRGHMFMNFLPFSTLHHQFFFF